MPLLVRIDGAAAAVQQASDAATASAAAVDAWQPLTLDSEGAARRKAAPDATPVWLVRLLRTEYLRQTARQLILARSSVRQPLPRLIYAHQREIAIASPSSGAEWIGSADATTCVIVILQCRSTKRTIVTHLDGADARQISGWSDAAQKVAAAAKGGPEKRRTAFHLNCTSVIDALNAMQQEDLVESVAQ